jgi:hypothetical protein
MSPKTSWGRLSTAEERLQFDRAFVADLEELPLLAIPVPPQQGFTTFGGPPPQGVFCINFGALRWDSGLP